MAMTLGDILINVKADTSELVTGFNRAEKSVQQTTKNMTTAVKAFAAAYISLNAIDLARTYARQADAMTNVNSKLKLVTSSARQLLDTQQKLYDISQKTRSAFTNNVDLYQKISFSTKELNLTQKQQLSLTEQINKELLISGTTAAGAATLITQLGQAFSSNFKAVSQEINTLKDQAPSLYQTILAGIGKTAAEFKKMAEAGELSSEMIINAIAKQASETNKNFSKIATTIDKAYGNLENSAQNIIGQFDKISGASKGVSDSILEISKSLDNINLNNYIAEFDFLMATTSRTVDMFNLLYETSENTAQNAVSGISNLVYGTLAPISHMLSVTAQGLNKIGLSSDQNVIDALELEISLYGMAEKAQQDIKENTKEITDAFYKANIPIEERIALYRKEREDISKNIELSNNTNNKEQNKQDLSKDELKALEKKKQEELAIQQSYDEYMLELDYNRIAQKWDYEEQVAEEKRAKLLADDKQWIEDLQEFYKLDIEVGFNEKSIKELEDAYKGIGSQDWTAGLTGQAKAFANVSNAMSDLGKDQKKFNALSQDEKDLNKDEYIQSQANGYAALAGSMAGVFSEGSDGAKAFQAVQATLGIVNAYTGITAAWASAPFPYNIPAVAAASASLLPIISTLTSMGGSGGGGTAPAVSGSVMQESKFTSELTEMTSQPILDELERQTELLEMIGLEGTAAKVRTTGAGTQYDFDMAMLTEEIIQSTQTLSANLYKSTPEIVQEVWETQFSKVNDAVAGVYQYDKKESAISFNASAFRGDPLKAMGAILEAGLISRLGNYQEAQKAGATTDEQINAYMTAQGLGQINELQEITHEYTTSLGDVIDTMSDAKDSFKDMYDDLTDSSYYADIELKKAQDAVNERIGDSTLPEYLKRQVEAIETVEKEFSKSVQEIFLSQDPKDIQDKVDALNTLEVAMGTAFEGGVEEALNYFDAIELVSESMLESTVSMKDAANNIFDAWNGNLSYLNLQQKTALADGYYELSQVENSSISSVDAALAKAEAAYKTARTKEDYIPVFNNYINELKNEAPENTLDDVVGRLDTLINRVEELEETQRRAS